jgi:hypothetical protein
LALAVFDTDNFMAGEYMSLLGGSTDKKGSRERRRSFGAAQIRKKIQGTYRAFFDMNAKGEKRNSPKKGTVLLYVHRGI